MLAILTSLCLLTFVVLVVSFVITSSSPVRADSDVDYTEDLAQLIVAPVVVKEAEGSVPTKREMKGNQNVTAHSVIYAPPLAKSECSNAILQTAPSPFISSRPAPRRFFVLVIDTLEYTTSDVLVESFEGERSSKI
ncbi:uncharacterized protein LOC142768317 [Rhipicephalus microplus]|uniref:uncharacterized protein LOC142768317 n=1 Tax=Rhipicephalus microplus TaxID=6941 RepID=UPI003F6A9516